MPPRWKVAEPMPAGQLMGLMKQRRQQKYEADYAEWQQDEQKRKQTIAAVGALAGGVIGLGAAGAAAAGASGAGMAGAGASAGMGAGTAGAAGVSGAGMAGAGASAGLGGLTGGGAAAAGGGGLAGLLANPAALESIQMGMGLGKSVAGLASGDDYTEGIMNIMGQLSGRRAKGGAGAGFTLGPDQVRYGPGGREIARGVAKAPPAPAATMQTREAIGARGEQLTPDTIKAERARQAAQRRLEEEKKRRADETKRLAAEAKAEKKRLAAEAKEKKTREIEADEKTNTEVRIITQGWRKGPKGKPMSDAQKAQDLITRGYGNAVIEEYPSEAKAVRVGSLAGRLFRKKPTKLTPEQARKVSSKALTPAQAVEAGKVKFKIHRKILRDLIKAKYKKEQGIELTQRPGPGRATRSGLAGRRKGEKKKTAERGDTDAFARLNKELFG